MCLSLSLSVRECVCVCVIISLFVYLCVCRAVTTQLAVPQDMTLLSASWDNSIRVFDDSVNGELREMRYAGPDECEIDDA